MIASQALLRTAVVIELSDVGSGSRADLGTGTECAAREAASPGDGVTVNYGPWHDRQRTRLQTYFDPLKDYATDFGAALAFADAARKLAESVEREQTAGVDANVSGAAALQSEHQLLVDGLAASRGDAPRISAWQPADGDRSGPLNRARLLRSAASCVVVQAIGKIQLRVPFTCDVSGRSSLSAAAATAAGPGYGERNDALVASDAAVAGKSRARQSVGRPIAQAAPERDFAPFAGSGGTAASTAPSSRASR